MTKPSEETNFGLKKINRIENEEDRTFEEPKMDGSCLIPSLVLNIDAGLSECERRERACVRVCERDSMGERTRKFENKRRLYCLRHVKKRGREGLLATTG